MYARVASWEGGEADAIRSAAAGIKERAASGPPEGLDSTGFMLLIDPDGGRAMGISLFESEDAMKAGDELLNSMSPPGDGLGTRSSVNFYEVAGDFRM
jgi:hypothetical protein